MTHRFTLITLAGILLLSEAIYAQDAIVVKKLKIVVQTLDGRNGKPLAHQRLLIFTGISSEAVKTHAAYVELMTDEEGVATLSLDPAKTRWVQPWPDGRTLCQKDPNQGSFSIATILSAGLATPNTCSSLVRESAPGRFIIFARQPTLTEEMKR